MDRNSQGVETCNSTDAREYSIVQVSYLESDPLLSVGLPANVLKLFSEESPVILSSFHYETSNNLSCKLNHLHELDDISYKPGNCFELLQSSTFALISQRALARATCRSPDVVTGGIKVKFFQFFGPILTQYFGELHLDTLTEFL